MSKKSAEWFGKLLPHQKEELCKRLYEKHRSIRAVAEECGIAYASAHKWIHRSGAKIQKKAAARISDKIDGKIRVKNSGDRASELVVEGDYHERPTKKIYDGKPRRYILTCMQNNTRLHEPTWDAVKAMAEYYDANLMISRFTYKLDAYGKEETKPGKYKHQFGIWFDPRTEPYWSDDRIEIAPGLVWCGELNILPTAVTPISGLEVYTGRASSIFPHVKMQMVSVASAKHEPTKFCYTTGTLTARNYIHKKAGLKADFHHVYGALLVEVDKDGDWFVRQLNVDNDGRLYDLNVIYEPWKGVVPSGGVEAINWGDIHHAKLGKETYDLCWGPKGIAASLQPYYQFMHDTLDFRSRNHHERQNPHIRYQRHVEQTESVEQEVRDLAHFLYRVEDCAEETVVVNSNHDMALERWLREADYRNDPVNAVYFLTLQRKIYDWISKGVKNQRSIVEWAVQDQLANRLQKTRFLLEDESFLICDREVECGMHGHAGPDGTRGGRNNFAKMGRKANIGHSHSAGIRDGIYQAGVTGSLDMGYNKGPSSWSRSHIVTYPNGKRAIITVWRNKWRAPHARQEKHS